jgi:predicted enzyme involved in methoxymalonyl-ACP biosynthesis
MEAEYIPTGKNAQVADYYDRMGMVPLDVPGAGRRYRTDLDTLSNTKPRWIEVHFGQ